MDEEPPAEPRSGRGAVAVVAVVVAAVVVVVGGFWLVSGSGGGSGSGCSAEDHVDDQDAGLCYRRPDGWHQAGDAGREVAVSSMISSGGEGAPASAMAGEWRTLFDAAPPGDTPEDAARWMVDGSGMFGAGDGDAADVASDTTEIDGHEAATATGEIAGDPAVLLQATVVELGDDEVVFLVTLTPAADDALVAATEDIHDSLAVTAG